jgi:hypothetical protein
MSDVAYEAVIANVEEKEWKAFVKKAENSFKQWETDRQGGSRNNFLNDRLLEIIPTIRSKDNTQKFRKIAMWLALYVEWREDIPSYLTKATPEIIEQFDAVIAEKPFSWDRIAKFAQDLANQYSGEIKEEK